MIAILPVLIFLAGVVAILALRLDFKDHPVTEAIRPWQSGLGALLGFVSLALSVQMNSEVTRASQRLEREAAGRHLALSLHAEILPLLARLNFISMSAATGSSVTNGILTKIDKNYLNDPQLKIRCSGGKKEITAVKPIGVFEANKANLGLLPGQLAYQFVDLHHVWSELNHLIAALPEQSVCTAELKHAIDLVEASANLVIAHMGVIDAEYKNLRILLLLGRFK